MDNETTTLVGATKVEGLVFFMSYPVVMLLSHLWTVGYEKFLKSRIVEPVPKSGTKVRLDLFICAFLGQTIWIASLSESTTFGTLLGVSGPVWYAFAGIMPTMFFMVLLVRFRMIAPGARTFLHVIYGRFGRTAHLMFCAFALLNNLYIIANIIEAGNRLFSSISTEITFDLVWIVAITIAGICVNCGKLHQMFPVCLMGSGFLMLASMAFFVGVYLLSSNPNLGSITKIYEKNAAVNDFYSGEVNRMSFRNWHTWLFAARKFLNSLAPQFMDQATWDTCCHAVPGEESVGIFVASVLWMTLPYAFATACSNGFIALTPHKALISMPGFANHLQPSVAVAKALFGRGGLLVLFIMYAFIIANISVFQLFSVSSILTFDIYAIHMRPFRVCFDVNCCLLCGKTRDDIFRPKDDCRCVPVTCCIQCQSYQMNRCTANGSVSSLCECRTHAEYLNYEKRLEDVRRSSILVIFTVVLPIGLFFNLFKAYCAPLIVGINVLVTAALGSLLYAFFWEQMTSAGMVIGAAMSASIASFLWVLLSALVRFYPNFSIDTNLLDVSVFSVSIMGGFIFPPLVVCIERRRKNFNKDETRNLQCQSWQRIYEMDNPLSPWALEYAASFEFNNFNLESYDRPNPEEVRRAFQRSWYFALGAAGSFFIVGVVIMPCVFYVLSDLDVVSFKIWICLVLMALVISAAVTLFVPIIWEAVQIYCLRRTQAQSRDKQHVNPQIECTDATLDDGIQSSFP